MQKSGTESRHKLLEDLSEMTVKTYKELEVTKQKLNEKELQLVELATVADQKIKEAVMANRELQNKVEYLQEVSQSLNQKNEDLERLNLELDIQKRHYTQLNNKFKKDLARLAEKEKNLEIQRNRLTFEIENKSKELIKSEKMASVGQLSSRLVHDLRNPLTVIKSSIEILKHNYKNMDSQTEEKFRILDRAFKKINYQIEEVLDFVRQSELKLTRQPISDGLDSALSTIEIPKKVRIKKDYRKVIANYDKRKFEAVFTNLITNAIQAIQEDGEIKLKTFDDGEDVLVKIEDSGPGISETVMEQMFEPLYTTKDTGTGLGLAICQSIVEQHGGKIEVSSPPTIITIRMPKHIRGFVQTS